MATGEVRVFGAIAAVYTSDGYEWIQQGDEVNRVDIYNDIQLNAYRIVSCAEDGTVLVNSALFAECQYEKASAQFHQWTGVDDESHGLSFATAKDAAAFGSVVNAAVKELVEEQKTFEASQAAVQADASALQSSRPLTVGDAEQSALVSAEQLLDLPRPVPFKSCQKKLNSSAAAYWRVETLLELCHHAPSHQTIHLNSMTQLIDIADFDLFCSTYKDFNVVDLWLYSEDVDCMNNVGQQGLQALGAQLARGVPLGMYRMQDDLCVPGTDQSMVLCKVALGRTLPMAVGGQLDTQVQLPTGYHSLYVPADMKAEPAALCADGTRAYFVDNYLVLNTNLVLPTHIVSYEYTTAAETDSTAVAAALQERGIWTNLALDQMPAIVDCCQSCGTGMPLDRFCGLCGVAVCMDCKMNGRHQGKDHVFTSVDDSYREMLAEVAELSQQIPPLAEQLGRYEDCLDSFMLDSLWQVDSFKQDLVAYESHFMQVAQAIELRKFDVERIVSDFDRLLEFHCYEQQMCPKVNFVAQWEHIDTMSESIKQRIRNLETATDLNRFTMALTRKNQCIVGARRQVMYREELIDRLANRLRERGVLTTEDEELISTL